jgi:gluconate 2-dehydrogenase gamma chain
VGQSSLLKRRQFLLKVTPGVAIAGLGVSACSKINWHAPPSTYTPSYFGTAEWAFVNAAVGRLIPAEGAGPGGVDRQMELPYGHGAYFYMKGPFQPTSPATLGYQLRYSPREIYRLGIAAADHATQALHGKTFAQLASVDQDSFLERMERGDLDFPSMLAPVFVGQLLANSREGYFADPLYGGNRGMIAWQWIGFPGARADFTDWLDQAGRAYPYGPLFHQRCESVMAERKKPVDAVIIGYGWTGAIMRLARSYRDVMDNGFARHIPERRMRCMSIPLRP